MNLDHIKFFADYIHSQLGIVYSESNFYQLENRLNEVALALGLTNVDELWMKAYSGINDQMKQLLLDIATNNETSFFRDKEIFRTLENEILPKYLAANPNKFFLRIWSCACSTGQEPYTLAILISEMRKKMKLPQIEIIATDVSDRALNRAKSGVFSQLEVQRGMPTNLLIQYFSQHKGENNSNKDEWMVKTEIKQMVQFQKLNILGPLQQLGQFDIVFCRNVLIYQNVPNKKEILAKITSNLLPGGILIMGAAESLLGLSDDYEQVTSEKAIYYRKKFGAEKNALTKAA